MKLPGEAWLSLKLLVTPYTNPQHSDQMEYGVNYTGTALFLFHGFIFKGMLQKL
jgi:hypothetical protein